MSDFKAKMHQIRFTALQRSPRPLAAFKGPTSKGGKGGEGKGKREREEGMRIKGKGREGKREGRGEGMAGKV